jgi:hypothetical protein
VRRVAAAITVAGAALALTASSGSPPVRHTGGLAPRELPPDRFVNRQLLLAAGGHLWWSAQGCRVTVLGLVDLRVRPVPGTHCRVWPSPDGSRAVATVGDPAEFLTTRSMAVLSGRPLAETDRIAFPQGYLNSPVAWSPDGRRVAFCVQTPTMQAVLIKRLGGAATVLAHRCDPVWRSQAGEIAVSDGRRVLSAAGHVLVSDRTLAQLVGAVPGRQTVTALAARHGLMAVAVAQGRRTGLAVGPSALLVIGVHGQLVARTRGGVTAVFSEVGIAPDGSTAWYFDGAVRRARVVDLAAGGALRPGAPATARWYAWSPSARYVAVAEPDGIHVLDLRLREQGVIRGVQAHDLEWSP